MTPSSHIPVNARVRMTQAGHERNPRAPGKAEGIAIGYANSRFQRDPFIVVRRDWDGCDGNYLMDSWEACDG